MGGAEDRISIECSCGHAGEVGRALAGKTVKCKACGSKLRIPGGAPPPRPTRRPLPTVSYRVNQPAALVLALVVLSPIVLLCWFGVVDRAPLLDVGFLAWAVGALVTSGVWLLALGMFRPTVEVGPERFVETGIVRRRELPYARLEPGCVEFDVDPKVESVVPGAAQRMVVHAETAGSPDWPGPLEVSVYAEWFVPLVLNLLRRDLVGEEELMQLLTLVVSDLPPAERDVFLGRVAPRSRGLETARKLGEGALAVLGGASGLGAQVAQWEQDERKRDLLRLLEDELGPLAERREELEDRLEDLAASRR